MFWDKVAGIYDLFGNVYNGKVDRKMCEIVSSAIRPEDTVLECACGTGMISVRIAPRCRKLVATDFSEGMLKQTKKKCAGLANVEVCRADITNLAFPDESFDAAVAANVIHLLDDPYQALSELDRVVKPGGRLIIPTYVNSEKTGKESGFSKTVGKAGADFKQQFTYSVYRAFFEKAGYSEIETTLIKGRVPCAVAVIVKPKRVERGISENA